MASCNNTCAGDGDCNQPNYGCNTGTSKCALVLGKSCVSGTDCASGSCAPEGICCTTACTGQCEACNAAGTCSLVSGSPRSPRAACTSDPSHTVCNGSCSGSSASCSYPTSSCGTQTCNPVIVGGLTTGYAEYSYACQSGTCMTTMTSCGNYNCNHGAFCGAPCSTTSECFMGTCHFNGTGNACF
jgi:hypothetical protein